MFSWNAGSTRPSHLRGEGLSIGDVLTWGPSYYYQKQFFTGHAASPTAGLEHPELQAANNVNLQPRPTQEDTESLLRYDVEVSGFPSSHCGHLVLPRLKDQDYPGTKIIQDWPSWNLPILKWVKGQGAIGGYAHCGIGMVVDSTDLPNYEIPPMDAIGTQEAIMDVTHGVCECQFDTPSDLLERPNSCAFPSILPDFLLDPHVTLSPRIESRD